MKSKLAVFGVLLLMQTFCFAPCAMAQSDEADAFKKALRTPLDASKFRRKMSFRKFLETLYDDGVAVDRELPILLNTDAFRKESEDLDVFYEAPIQLSSLPKKASAKVILKAAVMQLPSKNVKVWIHDIPGYPRFFVEVTTKVDYDEQMAWREARFHWECLWNAYNLYWEMEFRAFSRLEGLRDDLLDYLRKTLSFGKD